MNLSEKNTTSVRQEVKDVANVLQQVKTTIGQRYPSIVVNLKAERKGIKTTISTYGIGSYRASIDKMFQAYDKVHDLLIKEDFTVYPLIARKDSSKLHKETLAQ